jgi:hypothetical protein
MNTFQLLLVLVGQAFFMGLLAFAVVYGLTNIAGLSEDIVDIRVAFIFFVVSVVFMYGTSFGIYAGIQKDGCGEVKSWKQIAMNAAIPTIIQVVLMALVLFIPWFQNIVGDVLPPDTSSFSKSVTAYAYYTLWATLLGGALGGTLSGSCKADIPAIDDTLRETMNRTVMPPE